MELLSFIQINDPAHLRLAMIEAYMVVTNKMNREGQAQTEWHIGHVHRALVEKECKPLIRMPDKRLIGSRIVGIPGDVILVMNQKTGKYGMVLYTPPSAA
jgi:hypothetical protein